MRIIICKRLALVSAIALVSAHDAWAQSGALEEIIVTATRRETGLQNTPIAISAFSADTLERRSVNDLMDVTKYVPGLSIGSRAGRGAAAGGVAIRGMGVDSFDSSASVGIYVDNVYYAGHMGNILGILDVERLEVLRGPQGTLFGRNTIAGAIQYVTKEPSMEFGGYLQGTLGNFDRKDIEGAINIPILDTLAVRIAGMHNERDGYVKDLHNDVYRGAEEVSALRIRALWQPTDRLNIGLKAERLEQETNGRAFEIRGINPNAVFAQMALFSGETRPFDDSLLSPGDYKFAGYNTDDYHDFEFEVAQADLSYELADDVVFKSITSKASYKSRFAQDFDGTPLDILSLLPTPGTGTDVLTQEFQISGSGLSDRLEYTVGVYYYDGEHKGENAWTQRIGRGSYALNGGYPAFETISEAVYAHTVYQFTDRFSGTLGVRYSKEKTDSWLINETPKLTSRFEDVSPHIGVNFQLTPDVMLYAKASKGFRAGGFTASNALPGGGNPFDPETAWTYEAGARMEFLRGRLRINPTIFQTEWNDIQFNQLVATPKGSTVTTMNAGNAEIRGFELETQFAVTSRFQLRGSLSVLDAEYEKVGDLTYTAFPQGLMGPPVTEPNVLVNTPLALAPELKYSVGVEYAFPAIAGVELTASMDYSWVDEQQSAVVIAGTVEMPDYGLLNARIQADLMDGQLSIALFGTNLTDEHYLIGGQDFARAYTIGILQHDVARPREYGVEMKYNF